MRNKFKLMTVLLSVIALAFSGCKSSSKKKSSEQKDISSEISSVAPTSANVSSSSVTSTSASSQPSTPSSSSVSSSSSSATSQEPLVTGVTFSFADRVAEYVAKGYQGVEIPDYVCASSSATLTQPYPSEYPTYWLIKDSSSEEMTTFVASFSSAWNDEVDSYGDHYLYLGEPESGESCPFIYVGDYTAESLAGILISFDEYTEPVPVAAFPLEEVNEYLSTYSTNYGFTISQEQADAISALSTSFVSSTGTDSYGYPFIQIMIGGEVAEEIDAIMSETLTSAGFTYYSEYGAYYNSSYFCVGFVADSGYTYFIIN